MKTVSVTREQARRFLIHVFALEQFQSLSSPQETINRLEFVQEDSINICGRMHDLILWPRVAGYTPEHLAETLYGQGAGAFEYWFPNLCALPLEDYPHFAPRMQERAKTPGRWGALSQDEESVAQKILEALDTGGPMRTRTHGTEDGHTLSGWGTRATVVSQVCEKLLLQGRLSVARRTNFERYFDRTERVYPAVAHWHHPDTSHPDPTETTRHLARKRLRAKRLFPLKKAEMGALGKDAITEVKIEGVKRRYYCLAEDTERLCDAPPVSGDELFLLAPLDPLVYDRNRNRDLFDFDYTWEVYVPAEKRKWGYYVLPILQGEHIIGRVDPKLDRKTHTLNLLSLTLEDGIDPTAVAASLTSRLRDYATFLGAEQIVLAETIAPPIRQCITRP